VVVSQSAGLAFMFMRAVLFYAVRSAAFTQIRRYSGVFFRRVLLGLFRPCSSGLAFTFGGCSYGVKVGNWAMAILQGPTMFHFWYFYAIIGLYAFMPVLRKFLQHATVGKKAWFIGIWFVVASLIPAIKTLVYAPCCEGYMQSTSSAPRTICSTLVAISVTFFWCFLAGK
jgi:surface polysaccharide O-acyltransferase-like enzyme